MSEYPPHVCQYKCGRSFQSLHDLIIHTEANHIDFALELGRFHPDNDELTCIPFSYVLRYTSESDIAEYLAEESITNHTTFTHNLIKCEEEPDSPGILHASINKCLNEMEANEASNQSPAEKVRKYSCPIIGCSKSYKNHNGMKYHVATMHNSKTKLSIVKKEFECTLCDKKYKTARGLQTHISAHVTAISDQLPSSQQFSNNDFHFSANSNESSRKIQSEHAVEDPRMQNVAENVQFSNDNNGAKFDSGAYLDYIKRPMSNYQQQSSSNVLHKKLYDSASTYGQFYAVGATPVNAESQEVIASADWHDVDTTPKQYWVDSKGMPGYRQSEEVQPTKIYSDAANGQYQQSMHLQYMQYYQNLHNTNGGGNSFGNGHGADSFGGISQDCTYGNSYASIGRMKSEYVNYQNVGSNENCRY